SLCQASLFHGVGVMTEPYLITIEKQPDEELGVVLQGPGIDPVEGRRYVFATAERCRTFIQAVNFAYAQGVSEGLRTAASRGASRSTLVVSGRTPETLFAREETACERLRRMWRNRRRS